MNRIYHSVMQRFFLLSLFLAGICGAQAQTFSVTVNQTIPDNNTTVAFNISVSGLPAVIDTNFGLQTACLNMTHTYDSDMDVKLRAPDGTTVTLFSGVGGGSDNFVNTCLEGSGTPISSGSAPFTGTYKSMGTLGSVNNGQNPNGTWQLLCTDMAAVDVGFLQNWSLTFSSTPAMPFLFTSSNLPIIKLTTVSTPMSNDPKVEVYMQIIDNGPGVRNYTNQTNYAYEGTIMAEWQGFTGPNYPKKNYDFDLVDSAGNKIDTSLLGMPSENDWILKAEYLDRSLIKNSISYEFARRMGRYAPRTRPCEVILDGQYIGYYTLTEKVKRDVNRLDIANLAPADTSGAALTGGYIIEMNINGDAGAWNSTYPPINSATCGYPVEFKMVDPKSTVVLPVQLDYIHHYVDTFENVLNGPNYLDPVNGYRKYIDVSSFIDFLIVNEYSVNYDSYGRSTYMYKEKITDGGKLNIGPPWDYDRAIPYTNPGSTSGWVWLNTHPYWPFPFWWSKMWTDEDYRKELACRWKSLRENILHTDSFMVYIDTLAAHLNEAQGRNFTIWQSLGGETYAQQVDSVKSYLTRRLQWIDDELDQENVTLPQFHIPSDTVVCSGTVYDASFNGLQYTYNWQPGPDTSIITLVNSGTYTLKVTGSHGCYRYKTMEVTISEPDASFTSTPASGTTDWAFTPTDTQGSAYLWNFGDAGTSNQMSPTHTYTSNGTYIVVLALTDSIGCMNNFADTLLVNSVGLEQTLQNDYQVYPNPFSDKVRIRTALPMDGNWGLQITNSLGQTVVQTLLPGGEQEFMLSLGHLPPGIYLLRMEGNGQVWTTSLVRN